MEREYVLVTNASRDVLVNTLQKMNYVTEETENWEGILLRDLFGIGHRVYGIDQDNFDHYLDAMNDEADFIREPQSSLTSEIDESLLDMNEEFLIETGVIERMPEISEIENLTESNYKKASDGLRNLGYLTHVYVIEEGF